MDLPSSINTRQQELDGGGDQLPLNTTGTEITGNTSLLVVSITKKEKVPHG